MQNSEMQIEREWLPVGHFISEKIVMCCPCVTRDTLFNISALDFMGIKMSLKQFPSGM